MAYLSYDILLIDDDPALAARLRAFFSHFGLTLRHAPDPAASAEALKHGASPSLCLVDVNLATEIDGLTVVRAIRRRFGAGVPVLVISGSWNAPLVRKALESGADDFLEKPLEPEELKRALAPFLPLEKNPVTEPAPRKAPTGGVRGRLELAVPVAAAHELGLLVSTPHYVSPGVPIVVTAAILERAIGSGRWLATAVTCEGDQNGSYRVSLMLENLTPEQRSRWRRFLLELREGKRFGDLG